MELIDKLGITKETKRFLIINPPGNFLYKLGELHDDVQFLGFEDNSMDFSFSFLTTRNELEELFPLLKYKIKKSGIIWIAWPKEDADMETNLVEDFVRQTGIQAGLNDVRLLSYDRRWLAVKFIW